MNKVPFIILAIVSSMLLFQDLAGHVAVMAESKNISFDFDYPIVKGSHQVSISVPDGFVEPNASTTGDMTVNGGKMNITINVPDVGSTSVLVDSLGEQDLPVPSLNYMGVGVFLKIKGTIEGQLDVAGPGLVDKTSFEWVSFGSQPFRLNATTIAQEGDTINMTLREIEYALHIGVTAKNVPILGDVDLIQYQKIGSVEGSPSSVSGTFKVQRNPPLLYMVPWIVAAAFASASGVVGILYFKTEGDLKKLRAKMATPQTPPTPPQVVAKPVQLSPPSAAGIACTNCRAINTQGARFCRKCGKPL